MMWARRTPTCRLIHTPPLIVMPTKTLSLRKKNAAENDFFENRVFLHEKTIFTVTNAKTTA